MDSGVCVVASRGGVRAKAGGIDVSVRGEITSILTMSPSLSGVLRVQPRFLFSAVFTLCRAFFKPAVGWHEVLHQSVSCRFRQFLTTPLRIAGPHYSPYRIKGGGLPIATKVEGMVALTLNEESILELHALKVDTGRREKRGRFTKRLWRSCK